MRYDMEHEMIDMQDVSVKDREHMVLDHLELHVREGEFFCVAGGESGDRTALFRVLTGWLRPVRGSVRIDGVNVSRYPTAVRRRIGYVPAVSGTYGMMRVWEYLEYYAGLYGLVGEAVQKRAKELLQKMQLEGQEESVVDRLSARGKKQLSLARCMMHRPYVLLLDDFLEGLENAEDAEMLCVLLQEISREGETILLGSRTPEAAASLDPRLGLLEHGRICWHGAWSEWQARGEQKNPLEMVLGGNVQEAVRILKARECVTSVSIDGFRILAGFCGTQEEQAQILQEMVSQGVTVVSYGRSGGADTMSQKRHGK